MKDSADIERERERETVSHINGVRGDLTKPPLNTEHRKATLKPVEIYLYITHTNTYTQTRKHTVSMGSFPVSF